MATKKRHVRRNPSIWGFFTVKTVFLALLALGLLFGGIILIWLATLEVPSVDSFHNRRVAESTKIYDRTGKILLYDVHGTVRRTVIPLEDVSRNVKNATIAIEDAEFYSHVGIKPTAILRAVWVNLLAGEYEQGGSTITQQVIKNTVLTTEKTITRKVKEWILALKIEQILTKDQILEIYMNETPYGGTVYGVEEAALYFFGKDAQDLTLAESAYIAALPQAPTYYSPYGNHRDALEKRKNLVLDKMLENSFITQDEHDAAKIEEVTFVAQSDTGIKAPHFVFFVREYLEEKYGVQAVSEGGLKVITTIDFELQEKAQKVVTDAAIKNEVDFNAENAGLVAIDPKTGQILVMVGSRGYFDENIDGKFNIALAKRQPGSAFKPFVYATAFAKGYTPETLLFDLRTQFSVNCDPQFLETTDTCYSPDNYDHVYRGPMTLRDALAQSVNIPAVKLLHLTGIENSLETVRRMGITSLNEAANHYGFSFVLGGGEVSLLELVSAYGVFGNDGVRNPYTGVLRVEDASGNVLEEYENKGKRVIDAQVARQVNDVLSDNNARGPAFGYNSALYFREYDVAVKTGTTNDTRDVWIVGYSPTIVIGGWAGNNDNSPMVKKIAGFIIAPWWAEFVREALTHVPNEQFPEPEPISESLQPVLRGELNTGPEGIHNILYWVNKDNPLAGKPSNPFGDSQFWLWEYPVTQWVLQNGGSITGLPTSGGLFPNGGTSTSSGAPVAPAQNNISIVSPRSGAVVAKGSPLTMQVSAPLDTTSVRYILNGVHIGTSGGSPFSLTFVPTAAGAFTLYTITESPSGQLSAQTSFTVR